MIGYRKSNFSSYSLLKKAFAVIFFLMLCAIFTIYLLGSLSILLHLSSHITRKTLAAIALSIIISSPCIAVCFCIRMFAYIFWGVVDLVSGGVQICSPLGKQTMIVHWSEMICICYENPVPNGPKGKETICFVRMSEKENVYGRWRVGAPLHFLKVIAVRYSPHIVEDLTAEYGANVIDLRETLSYK